jgi:2-aminoadipate transaminase
VLVKQGTDLQSSTLLQRIVHKYLELYDVDRHIEDILRVYRKRRDVMVEAMRRLFPAETVFTRPQGGLFIWRSFHLI